ncbi:helix-turn-helix domain-containing protein [Halalkalibacter oceani]|uniref:helix-turn-helix domain-containing protein n=1 Tax=Halalkalibacter oceani TaxID=1653776 RepID=UPI0033938777
MLGQRIASLRKQKGISQYELADRLGFSRGKLANYEQGSRQPDYDTLNKIADFFDVSVDYLLGRTDNPKGHLNIAYDGGGLVAEDEEEEAYLLEQQKQYRKMKKRMQERMKKDK